MYAAVKRRVSETTSPTPLIPHIVHVSPHRTSSMSSSAIARAVRARMGHLDAAPSGAGIMEGSEKTRQ